MIYVVRHGQTDWNKDGKIQGRVNTQLNGAGVEQAWRAKSELGDRRFDVAFCSTLERVMQTCNIVYDGTVIYDERLVERDFGQNDGLQREELDFAAFWTEGTQENSDCNETLEQMRDRVFGFLDELKEKYADKEILICTHGGVIMLMNFYFHGMPADGNYLNYLVTNGSVTTFDFASIADNN